ncbi:MAG: ATP synthase F1 subunit gamma [Bacteroidales bacterium]|nr:ATP synthase F1 subunit gamma [Bacteroidales bacterium]
MSSLREVKDRIASVRSTLKITSAMKLVASSKLRKAQRTIEALRPYATALEEILAAVQGAPAVARPGMEGSPREPFSNGSVAVSECPQAPFSQVLWAPEDTPERRMMLLLAFSSNSSMCGAFNSNAIKRTLEEIRKASASGRQVEVWAFGKKMAEALRKNGTPATRDYSGLVAHADYSAVAAIAREIREMYAYGKIGGATLVYNHFVSTGRQQVLAEPYIGGAQYAYDQHFAEYPPAQQIDGKLDTTDLDYLLEPSRAELLEALLPQVGDLKLYAALLDSAAAEHAARMIAMQAATDNGETLLAELTLEYNKGRQQKITSEILDLVSGAAV